MPHVEIVESDMTPQRASDAYRRAAHMQMEQAMIEVESQYRLLMPVRTGHLRRSLTHMVTVVGNQIIGAVGTALRYGVWLNDGTGIYGPHKSPIVPVKARALRFPTPGNAGFTLAGRQRSGKAGAAASWVVVKSVKGVQARHFFERGFELTRTSWTAKLELIPTVARKLLGVKA